MNARSLYSFSCAAFAAVVACAGLGGCFSERVAGGGPSGAELCAGTQPNVVRIRDYAFGPGELAVSAGTTVTFVNCDPDSHTSTSDTGVWDSNLLTPNAVFQRTFSQAGRYPYHCDPHPFMTGAIVVN